MTGRPECLLNILQGPGQPFGKESVSSEGPCIEAEKHSAGDARPPHPGTAVCVSRALFN